MWEWRIFYPETDVPHWVSRVMEILQKTQVEERSDLYYNLYSYEFGMKIRKYSQSSQLFELKILRGINEEFELWDKPIKQTIQWVENQSFIDMIVSSLNQSALHIPEINKILEILSDGKFGVVKITKRRKKNSIRNISVESVEIEYENKKQLGVQLECHTPSLLEQFMLKELAIPVKKYSNTSYPRFLLNL